jgi:hypothetical protein
MLLLKGFKGKGERESHHSKEWRADKISEVNSS